VTSEGGYRPPGRLRVAYQGEPGAFSEVAIAQLWGRAGDGVSRHDFPDVVRAVVDGAADAGVLPVWNAVVGRIASSVAALRETRALAVVGETEVAVRLQLLALPGVPASVLCRVASHPVALGQCGRYLARHPGLAPVLAHDTAGAARAVAESGDPRSAAIAGPAAAERYGLVVLADRIADRSDNRTRFVAVVRRTG